MKPKSIKHCKGNKTLKIGQRIYLATYSGVEPIIIKKIGRAKFIFRYIDSLYGLTLELNKNYCYHYISKDKHKAHRRKKRIIYNYYKTA